MLFTSYPFIFVFLPLVLAGFFLIGRVSPEWAAAWLTAASFLFYGWWDARIVALLLASIAFNYGVGYAIWRCAAGRRAAKQMLTAGVVTNLLVLVYFKYANFLGGGVSGAMGLQWADLSIALPLGISFFTFTQTAFLVDTYRGLAAERHFLHYCLFVTYFPHLIAGPVLHHKQMMPQFALTQTYRPQVDRIAAGMAFIAIGMAKKILLADSFAEYANPVFDRVHAGVQPGAPVAWIGALAYTFQLYFDFSGYSDMAVGLSMLFGVKLPINFNSPYKAANIIDFWRRWHISLSEFLRDYLYIALGGNFNLLATMVLGGLWHGASWTFVAWGALHGLYLVINHGWHALTRLAGVETQGRAYGAASRLITFLSVVVAWVFFRAADLASAWRMLTGMFSFQGLGEPDPVRWMLGYHVPPESALGLLVLLVIGLSLVWLVPNSQALVERFRPRSVGRQTTIIGALAVLVALLVAINGSRASSDFIYFNF
jgi:alginate O-acetyltransferase complex protein AlgI